MFKRFKNGNINIKYSAKDIVSSKRDKYFFLSELLCWNNCYINYEPLSAGNFDCMYMIYDTTTDKVLYMLSRDFETMESGKTLKLYAMTPDEDELKKVNEFL